MGVLQDFQTEWTEKLDPRVVDLPLVASNYQVPLIILAYIYIVLVVAPRFMKNRKPYSLKKLIQLYNIVQIAGNALLVYDILDAGLFTRQKLFLCPIFDYSYDETPMRLIRSGWYFMMLKILDYMETVIFILRKKNNQVSALHLYHHVSTLGFSWLLMRYYTIGPVVLISLLNTIVHVIMYTYYFLAACGPEVQKSLATIKRYLTIIQMVQFILIILYVMQNFIPRCKAASDFIVFLFLGNMVTNFYLFYSFYQRAYKKKSDKKMQ
ncbi:elongation of very long chain fatty acids protein AAEL008004 [Ooceraea biroi]|uniref:Elongation of very long chain fatty acids protein n=1 Tax=Ooceraea biroi TaxID=2015173 RepID=A0A026W6I8_OOCBI|nr:elongation of very long chain fatty acids protein AAEL008004 [Ooceraea biroi]EZA51670.1 Elongation of very long chain fatty acids protein [Ooceraea biroi]